MRIVYNYYSVNLFLLLLIAVDCFFFHCYHATCDGVTVCTVVSDGCLATCNGGTAKSFQ